MASRDAQATGLCARSRSSSRSRTPTSRTPSSARTSRRWDLIVFGVAVVDRRRHLHAHRAHGGRRRRAVDLARLRSRRHRVRPRRALLRRVRLDRAGRGQRLHVLLRHVRRVRRLDHRLGPHPGVRARRAPWSPRAGRCTWATVFGQFGADIGTTVPLGPRHLDWGAAAHRRGPHDRCSRSGTKLSCPGQPGDHRDQGRDRPPRDRRRLRSTSRRANYTPYIPPASAGGAAASGVRPVAALAARRGAGGSTFGVLRPARGARPGLLRVHRFDVVATTAEETQEPAEGRCPAASSARWPSSPCSTWPSPSCSPAWCNYTELGPRARRHPGDARHRLRDRSASTGRPTVIAVGALAGLTTVVHGADARPDPGALRDVPRRPAAARRSPSTGEHGTPVRATLVRRRRGRARRRASSRSARSRRWSTSARSSRSCSCPSA